MSLKRLLLVARKDLVELPSRPLYLIWALFLAWNGYLMSRGNWIYRSVDTSVGTQVSWFNSEFQVAFVMGLIGFLFIGFFVALAVGMPLVRDATYRVGELLHATPLRVSEYVWGKFLAALAGVLAVVAVLVLSDVAFSHLLPDTGNLEAYAPFQARAYVVPTLVFLVPAVVLLAGASLALGAFFNRALVVFLLPISTFMFYQQFFWGWFPADMSQGTFRLLQLFDPSGFRWLKQNWLMTDRGIHFYNTTPIDYDPAFLASRLAFVGLGLVLVAWTSRHLSRKIYGVEGGRKRTQASSGVEKPAPRWQAPLATLGMRAKAPGLGRGIRSVTRFELAELLAHPSLYIFVPLVFFSTFVVLEIAESGQGGVFSPPRMVTSGGAAAITLTSLNIWVTLLVLFYCVESLRREWETGVASIYYATPVRTASILIGKTMANAAVMLAIAAATFAAVLVKLAQQPDVSFELTPFVVVWGLLFVPTFLLWITFVTATYALTRSRFVTYGIGLGTIALTAWWAVEGEMTWLTNWPLLTVLNWSDISVFELDRRALVLNRVSALGLAALLAAVSYYAYQRRGGDALERRSDPRGRRRTMLATAMLCAVPLTTGFLLWKEVHTSFQGDDARRRQKQYWRQNVGTWGPSAAEVTLPELAHVELDLDLEPGERRFRAAGWYDLVNRTGQALPWLPVTGGLYWDEPEWTLDGNSVTPEERSGLYLFHLDEPLAPEATLRLGFSYSGVLAKGSTRNGIPPGTFEFILPSGIVVTGRNPDFVPVIGYVPTIGIDDDNRYESRIYPHNFHEGVTPGDIDRSWFTHRLRISAPEDFTVNSTGALTNEEHHDGRRTWTWESDYPVRVFNVIAGRWEVRRGEGTAVFYDARHPHNVDSMLEALDATRRYFSEWYYPYPWHELRLSEFPSVVFYARGNATNIFFSEGTGFLTAPDARADLAFAIAAHEAAHSWWGHIVSNGAGPGGIVLSEGGAHFATLMLIDQVRGSLQRTVFARQMERTYGEFRQPTSEEPLAETDYDRGFADATVIYDKGGWVLWMLMRQMGRDAFLDGVREYFRTYHKSEDYPVIQDFVAAMRPFAPDPDSYERFTRQWFFGLEVPEYRIAAVDKKAAGEACADCRWDVHVEVLNAGTAVMPVTVAATRGRRFERDGGESPDYRDCRGELELGAGETGTLDLVCGFEPERVTVDPDVMVLQLQRPAASVRLR